MLIVSVRLHEQLPLDHIQHVLGFVHDLNLQKKNCIILSNFWIPRGQSLLSVPIRRLQRFYKYKVWNIMARDIDQRTLVTASRSLNMIL